MTIYQTPIIKEGFKLLFKCLFRLTKWQLIGPPPESEQFVLIALPHRSAWDGFLLVGGAFIYGLNLKWALKSSCFHWSIAWLLRWCGAFPICQGEANNMVETCVNWFTQSKRLTLCIAPEGTRKKASHLHSGFYHIAFQARVPIYLGFIDHQNKKWGVGHAFYPSGEYDAELPKILSHYKRYGEHVIKALPFVDDI